MRSSVSTALVMLQRALRAFDTRSLAPFLGVAPIAALLTAVLAVSPAALAAAPPTVSASISTGYAKRTLALCGDRDRSSYTYFHRGARILIQGAVRPGPAQPWHVTIRRKHCVGKKFEGDLGDIFVAGRPDGSFRTAYTAGLTGVFLVRVLYDLPTKPGGRITSATYRLIVR